MSLALSESPGFAEIPSATFDDGNPVSAETAKALNANAAFAAVRNEQFWGFYKHGETVQLPASPADGYAYAREELLYSWSVYWTAGAPAGALNGTQSLPNRGATGGAGHLLQTGAFVNPVSGDVTIDTSYHKDGGSQGDTNDGILLVITHAQRNR